MHDDYQRIAEVLAHVEAHAQRQPELGELAAAVGLSPGHLQRLFTRWAGISPKRFLQSVTVAHARALLREGETVLEASHAVGLSGPGRLHDLTVSLEAMTPGEVRRRGAGLSIGVCRVPTPVGDALIARTERGLCALEFLASDDDAPDGWHDARARLAKHWPGARLVEDDPGELAPTVARIFAPDGGALSVAVKGTNFQVQVWRALLRIPRGRLSSYGALAQDIGNPKASRAVGSAVGANPISVLIPCHRVLRRHGELGGYRWGTPRKLALLGRELA